MATPKSTKTAPAPAAGGQGQPTATPPAADAAAAKAAKEARESKDVFVRVFTKKDGKDVAADSNGKKLPPQAQGIANILEAAGEKGLSRADLVTKMKGVIQTKQPEGRILSYYQKMLQDRGMVKMQAAA